MWAAVGPQASDATVRQMLQVVTGEHPMVAMTEGEGDGEENEAEEADVVMNGDNHDEGEEENEDERDGEQEEEQEQEQGEGEEDISLDAAAAFAAFAGDLELEHLPPASAVAAQKAAIDEEAKKETKRKQRLKALHDNLHVRIRALDALQAYLLHAPLDTADRLTTAMDTAIALFGVHRETLSLSASRQLGGVKGLPALVRDFARKLGSTIEAFVRRKEFRAADGGEMTAVDEAYVKGHCEALVELCSRKVPDKAQVMYSALGAALLALVFRLSASPDACARDTLTAALTQWTTKKSCHLTSSFFRFFMTRHPLWCAEVPFAAVATSARSVFLQRECIAIQGDMFVKAHMAMLAQQGKTAHAVELMMALLESCLKCLQLTQQQDGAKEFASALQRASYKKTVLEALRKALFALVTPPTDDVSADLHTARDAFLSQSAQLQELSKEEGGKKEGGGGRHQTAARNAVKLVQRLAGQNKQLLDLLAVKREEGDGVAAPAAIKDKPDEGDEDDDGQMAKPKSKKRRKDNQPVDG